MTNAYDTWRGAGSITAIKLFASKQEELPRAGETWAKYKDILRYLPVASDDGTVSGHFFVARVPTKTKKSGSKDVLKIFTNSSWSTEFQPQLEGMEFTFGDDDDPNKGPDRLVSDDPVDLPAGELWTATSKIEIFRNLVPEKIVAKILFDGTGGPVSAFWCWVE
jgi:hypothetical protein